MAKGWPYLKAAAVGAAIVGGVSGIQVHPKIPGPAITYSASAAISGAIAGGVLGLIVDFIVKHV